MEILSKQTRLSVCCSLLGEERKAPSFLHQSSFFLKFPQSGRDKGGRGGISYVCQQGPHQVTQSDLYQPGLIKAALRPRGLETQRCFCRPHSQGVFPPEGSVGARGRGGEVLLIREKESIPWLRCTLFHSLLVEIKQFIFMYVFWNHAVSISPLINPRRGMALINGTLFTSLTCSARCSTLPPINLPFLSFFPSDSLIFFHHFFSASNSKVFFFFHLHPFHTSGSHTSYFSL